MSDEWIRPDKAYDKSTSPTYWNSPSNAIDDSVTTYARAILPDAGGMTWYMAILEMWYGESATGPDDATEKSLSKAWLKFQAQSPCGDGKVLWHLYAYYNDAWRDVVSGKSGQVSIDGEYSIGSGGESVKGFKFTIVPDLSGPGCAGYTFTGDLYDVVGWEVESGGVPPGLFESMME